MTPEEIKQELAIRRITIAEFAARLGVGYTTLRNALAGHTPLTKALEHHIQLALGKREAVLVYRVDVGTRKVEELTAGRGCVTELDHWEAMQAILEHNLQELIKVGALLEWTAEQRAAFGLPPATTTDYTARRPFA